MPLAPENFFLHIFPCVGQSVSGWVPLELSPPPPLVGARQMLWVPAKSGCLPLSFRPPPPLLIKTVASTRTCTQFRQGQSLRVHVGLCACVLFTSRGLPHGHGAPRGFTRGLKWSRLGHKTLDLVSRRVWSWPHILPLTGALTSAPLGALGEEHVCDAWTATGAAVSGVLC